MGKKNNVNAGILMIRGKNKGRTFRSDFILPWWGNLPGIICCCRL